MLSWIPYVFVRVVIFFMTGIISGIYFPDLVSEDHLNWFLIALLFSYLVLFVFFRTHRLIHGTVALVFVLTAGHALVERKTDSRDEDHLVHADGVITYYQAIVTQHPQQRGKSWKVEARVTHLKKENWQSAKGRILIYLSREDFATSFQYGDVLLVRGSPQPVPAPSNPGEFDYRRFLQFRNIYHQHFLRKGDVRFIRSDPPYRFMQLAFKTRAWADATLKKFVHGEREQATASALVLGVTDGLDNELLDAYAATGAMHVLAVSGLHISIIYMIISMILRPLLRISYGKQLLAVMSIALLWAYSFVTGLSPSVLRAVVMFSFMAIARASDRQTNIYNTLAAAAFCLLLYEPQMIMSVGFQLSFLAVLGIVYLHPRMYQLWEPRPWLLNEVWKISCVSMAAQMITFPLGLLYFHQFPNYFLLSNLFVIPASFVVLIAGLAVLAASVVELAATGIGFILEWSIRFLNWIVFTTETFPFSLIDNINISVSQCWIMSFMMVCLILLFVKRRLFYLKMAVLSGAMFAILQWMHFYETFAAKRLIVYKIRGYSAIDMTDHGHSVCYSDSLLPFQNIKFHVQPNRLLHGVSVVHPGEQIFPLRDGIQLIIWNGKKILRVTAPKARLPGGLAIDFLIVGNNAIGDFSKLVPSLQNTRVILDSSNSFYFADKALRNARGLKLNACSVGHTGAFEINF